MQVFGSKSSLQSRSKHQPAADVSQEQPSVAVSALCRDISQELAEDGQKDDRLIFEDKGLKNGRGMSAVSAVDSNPDYEAQEIPFKKAKYSQKGSSPVLNYGLSPRTPLRKQQ